ncbi:uncharacterized protein LOC132196046 isoform X2 [Neocloeon triangulifer]|uniref:uncharacterized protein LOC132196046 isoform X2 n=1 Tax=Neocloeon triangulifer TaxID=2078957 RepID=UPI00286F60AD|nr:uncharacterized protein LOC132196046 isoform X2 [Neocloeon triangulifer]
MLRIGVFLFGIVATITAKSRCIFGCKPGHVFPNSLNTSKFYCMENIWQGVDITDHEWKIVPGCQRRQKDDLPSTINEEVSFDDWWNTWRKEAPVFTTPVFNTSDGENLSFKECGIWENDKDRPMYQYYVFISDACTGLILSERTIITRPVDANYGRCNEVHKEFVVRRDERNEEMAINVYGGECADKGNIGTCRAGKGLLSQKVRDVKRLRMSKKNFQTQYFVLMWLVDKMIFTPSLRPVCLWNGDNQNDRAQEFYVLDGSSMTLRQTVVLPMKQCYKNIKIGLLDPYRNANAMCTTISGDFGYIDYLFIKKGGRVYLRASLENIFLDEYTDLFTWFDLLPSMRRIVHESADLAMMPQISNLKKRIDFGAEQSFENCGRHPRRNKQKRDDKDPSARGGFIVGGRNSAKGRHPWHGNLLEIDPDTGLASNICGATLISKTTLVTAGHCLLKNDANQRDASALVVVLGMHNVPDFDESSRQEIWVSSFLVHPGYNPSNFKNDIALIILEVEVNFTEYVQPICLWNSDYDLNKIANRTGTVVGWGLTSDHSLANVLQEAEIKVVSYEECYESKRLFFSVNLHPRENFCAGFPQNRSGACKGDSGGGFSMFDRDTQRHFLRGVVSLGRVRKVTKDKEELLTCDPNFYALFTDVANYMRWIVTNSPELNFPAKPKPRQAKPKVEFVENSRRNSLDFSFFLPFFRVAAALFIGSFSTIFFVVPLLNILINCK